MANPVVKSVADEGLNFYNTLVGQQQQEFGENQTALTALSKAWAPVLTSGAVPYGYSPALDSLLQANVIQTGTQAESNATNAAAMQEKQESGGANVLPTGANAQINADILATGQQKIASGLQQEKIAGYQQGLSNLEGGTKAELGIADATNPAEAAKATEGAGSMAEEAGAEEFKENQETGPMAQFSNITGGLANLGKSAEGFAGSFHKGGVVPGKKGQEVHLVARAGEYIIPEPKTAKRKSMLDKVLASA
jgi:hypothetical protein